MTQSAALEVGTRAPDFVLPTQAGTTVRLSDLTATAPVVLWFFSRTDSPAAVAEASAFEKALDTFRARGVTVMGMTAETVEGLAAFARKHGVHFPLLADATSMVTATFRAMNGKGPRHLTYVIGADCVVRQVFERIVAEKHPAQVLEALDAAKSAAPSVRRPSTSAALTALAAPVRPQGSGKPPG